MARIIRQSVPLVVFLFVVWIGHDAMVDHVAVVVGPLILIAAGTLATLAARIFPPH
jgi:hypothetical protein